MSISAPGNDFRLGACEAPPAIVSTYLGDDMTDYLEAFKDGKTGEVRRRKLVLEMEVC
jgi:glutamine synthetase